MRLFQSAVLSLCVAVLLFSTVGQSFLRLGTAMHVLIDAAVIINATIIMK